MCELKDFWKSISLKFFLFFTIYNSVELKVTLLKGVSFPKRLVLITFDGVNFKRNS